MVKLRTIGICFGLAISTAISTSCQTSSLSDDSILENPIKQSAFALIKVGNSAELSKLIEQGIDLEQRNEKGETLLMYAVYMDQEAIAISLMRAGADVNAQDKIQNSPFLYAGAEGKYAILVEALNHKPNFGIYNRYGGTALIPAAEKGHLEVVKVLVNYPNYPKDHINRLGWTALLEAIILTDGSKVFTDIVDELIKGGVNVNIADAQGTPLYHAKRRNYTGMVQLLEAAGAK